jgi:hypothetical protein
MEAATAPILEPDHSEDQERPRLVEDLPDRPRRANDARWLDPTQGTQIGSDPYDDPTQGRVGSELYLDPTQGTTIGSHPYDDPTQGRMIASRPYDDPTQGRTLQSDPYEDPTRAR